MFNQTVNCFSDARIICPQVSCYNKCFSPRNICVDRNKVQADECLQNVSVDRSNRLRDQRSISIQRAVFQVLRQIFLCTNFPPQAGCRRQWVPQSQFAGNSCWSPLETSSQRTVGRKQNQSLHARKTEIQLFCVCSHQYCHW